MSRRAFIQKNPDVVNASSWASQRHPRIQEDKRKASSSAAFLKTTPGPALAKAYDVSPRASIGYSASSLKGIALVLNEMKTKVPKAGTINRRASSTRADRSAREEGFYAKLN